MSAVFLDPVAMDATAKAVTAHAAEVEATARDLEGVGAGAVPPALAGWLESELADIATTVRVTAVLYLVAAMDTILRAEAMRTNQSLATAFPTLGTVTPAFAETGFVLGAVQPATSPFTSAHAGSGGFVLGTAELVDSPIGGSATGGFVLGPTTAGGSGGVSFAGARAVPDLPLYLSDRSGSSSGMPAPGPGSRIVEEQATTLQLIGMEAKSWSALNRSMSRF